MWWLDIMTRGFIMSQALGKLTISEQNFFQLLVFYSCIPAKQNPMGLADFLPRDLFLKVPVT